jgi:hypothetical protein
MEEFMQAAHHGVPPARLPLGGALPPVVIEGDGAQVGDPVAGLMRDLAPVPVSRDATGATETGMSLTPPADIGADPLTIRRKQANHPARYPDGQLTEIGTIKPAIIR